MSNVTLCRARLILLAAFGLCILNGCQQGTAPITGIVKCRAVIVLGPTDTRGNPTNNGCRLSIDQVRAYIIALQIYGPRFGNNAQFTFADDVLTWVDPLYTRRNYDTADWAQNEMSVTSNAHDPGYKEDMINIYFVGDIRNRGIWNPPFNHGITFDPSASQEFPDVRPFIAISDRGFGEPPYLDPSFVLLSDRVLEHEMCHFLLRQMKGLNDLNTNAIIRYDEREHDVPSATHLIRPHPPCGHILAIDKAEISGRVVNNRFLLPQ